MKHLAFVLLFLVSLCSYSQVNDDFSDGDFSNAPAWIGNTTYFDASSGTLRSNGPQSGSSIFLSTSNTLIDSTEWSFLLRLDFNPSSTNKTRIYLVSDTSDLNSSLNGYFVQFGEAGTAPDSLDIFKQTGSVTTKVFTGSSGIMTSSSSNVVRIKVIRHAWGLWEVFTDKTGGENFSPEGSFTDLSTTSTKYFGFACDYATASRYNLYYLDDVSISPILVDTIKPIVQTVTVITSSTIDIKFSERVNTSTATNLLNYFIDNSIGNPISAIIDAADSTLIHLSFSNSFQNGSSYVINISNVADLSQNVMDAYSFPFSFYHPQPYDVVINELMPDPDPQVGLPVVEFVELYNRTSLTINLSGWHFSDASTTVTIPAISILPDSFVVLCASLNVDSFPGVATAGLSALPSLNNTGDQLTLSDNSGNVIHSLGYSSNWYQDATKQNGGWTIEMINPGNPCITTGNWIASNDLSGGTPGRRNSVYNNTLSSALSLTKVVLVSSNSIQLTFSQSLDGISATTLANYVVDNNLGSPSSLVFDTATFNQVTLFFSSPFDSNTIYTVTANVNNCAGIAISTNNTGMFAIPVTAEKYDVVFSEIFPDPDPSVGLPEAEFVELHNRSNKVFNLQGWELSKGALSVYTLPGYLLLPDSFVVLCSSSNVSLFAPYRNVLPISSFPALTNTGDKLILKNAQGNLIHLVQYNDDWYGDDNKKDGGWALELVDAGNPCAGSENWKASVDASGGTPGAQNSIAAVNPDTIPPHISKAYLIDSFQLTLVFDEPVDESCLMTLANYTVDNSVGSPTFVSFSPFDPTHVTLTFPQPFNVGIIYTITALSVCDCAGNTVVLGNEARFAIPENAQPGDVLINEILFNPSTGGYDFVEFYNHSQRIIDLSSLQIAEKEFSNPSHLLEQGNVSNENYLLFPGDFVVISENINNVKSTYYCQNPDAMINSSSLPNFADDESIVVLSTSSGVTIDSLVYLNDWHFPLLDDQNGVSLERVDYDKPTTNKNNWHSAASTVGFATPTYLNSQFSETGISDDAIQINPEVFSPDNDGNNDFALIEYKFNEPGYTCNVRVFDAVGREIKHLVRSELLASTGQFQWDGTDEDGNKARVGIYIFSIEVFNLDGKVKRYKRNVVLGARLD